jgi:hypothetical protein
LNKTAFIISVLLPFSVLSQTIKGKVYDDAATVNGAKIVNITQQRLTYTNDKGDFEIGAVIGDSIVFSSLFHFEKTIKVTKSSFEDLMVVELKKVVNELDEVVLTKEIITEKDFDPVVESEVLQTQILNDIKANPHLYSKSPSGNADIIAIVGLIAKLFKSKKPKKEAVTYVTLNQLKQLFSKNSYYNDTFLTRDLNIPLEYKALFLEYCEAQAIETKLLAPDNRFMLVDTLVKCSNEFLEIVNNHKKD